MTRQLEDDSTEPTDLTRISEAIYTRAGISAAPNQVDSALQSIAQRRAQTKHNLVRQLLITGSGEEWDDVLAELTIPETFFFRLQEHWAALNTTIIPRLRGKPGTLKVWCAACATGEEAYSLSMTFLAAGISANIFATDLVNKYLDHARNGEYSIRALRGGPLAAFKNQAEVSDEILKMKRSLKSSISFSQLNLLDRTAFANHALLNGPFDIIFCRNVLIYFSPQICTQILDGFSAALSPTGYLFVGAAEFPGLWTTSLKAEFIEKAYIWRAADAVATGGVVRPEKRAAQPTRETRILTDESSTFPGPSFEKLFEMLARPEEYDTVAILGEARSLVDNNEVDLRAHLALGLAFELAENTREALAAYSHAIFLDKKCAFPHWRQAMLYSSQRDPGRALSAAKWAKQISIQEGATIFSPPGMSFDELGNAIDETLQWLNT